MPKEYESWLIVDGYNVIGTNHQTNWNSTELANERLRLIRDLSEYQSMTDRKVFVVFDAHRSHGSQVKTAFDQITVIYTQYGETADECIERLVRDYKSPHRRIYVATSDYLEQRLVFGQGAYRISSRELIEDMQIVKGKIRNQVTKNSKKNLLVDRLSADMKEKLEKWRRKK